MVIVGDNAQRAWRFQYFMYGAGSLGLGAEKVVAGAG
jgi:hypothetical protein